MKATMNLIYITLCILLYSSQVSYGGVNPNEIFTYTVDHSGQFSMDFVLTTGNYSDIVAVAAYDSPIYVYDVEKSENNFYSEKDDPFSSWKNTKFTTFLDNDTKLFSAFSNFSPDPDSAYLYDLKTKKLLYRSSKDAVYVACSYDGSLFFTQNDEYSKLTIHNTLTQETIATINTERNVLKLCYPEKSNIWCILYSINNENIIVVYDKNTNNELYRVKPTEHYVRTIRLSQSGEYCALTGAAGIDQTRQITLYTLTGKKVMRQHTPLPFERMSEVEFSADNTTYTFAVDNTIYVYDINSGTEISRTTLPHIIGGAVMGLRWLPNSKKLIAQCATEAGYYSTIIDPENKSPLNTFALPNFYYVHLFSGGDKVLLTGPETVCYNRKTGVVEWNFGGFIPERAFQIDETNNRFVFSRGSSITLMELHTSIVLKYIQTGISNIFCVRLSRSGRYILYLARNQKIVYIYDTVNDETKTFPVNFIQDDTQPTDVYWDDITTKKIAVHGFYGLLVLDENFNRLYKTSSISFALSDYYSPQATIGRSFKGKVFSNKNSTVLSQSNSAQHFCFYDYGKDTLYFSKTRIPFDVDVIPKDPYYYSMIKDETTLLTIHPDSTLSHWDLETGTLLFKKRLPVIQKKNSGFPNFTYSASHGDGQTVVATQSDNRLVVFMEIPDEATSVNTENNIVKHSITTYPNPLRFGEGNCTVQLPQTAIIYSVKSYNILGQVIDLPIMNANGNTCVIDTKSLSIGTYILTLHTQTNTMYSFSITVL